MNSELLSKIIDPIIVLDGQYSNRLRIKEENRILWRFTAFLAHSGDSWFWLTGLVLVWLFSGKEWHYKAAVLAISLVFQAIFVLAIKFMVRRRRPVGEWGAIYRSTDPHSFPSGHAARAALLMVLSWGLGPGWFAWLLTIWAPMVSMARVMMGLHYLSDVLVGVIVGSVVGCVMLAIQHLMVIYLPFLF